MLRLQVTVLMSLFSLPALASQPTNSTASRPMDKAEVVVVHFGDSTCITSYLPAEQRVEAVLNDRLATQVTTHSTMGALAYETGGILIDSGWVRFLGSGHPKLNRNLADWNDGRSHGFYLVADDAVGGFFAVNGGAFGGPRDVFYWAPDTLEWESLGFGFTQFFQWSLTSSLADFYQDLRWPTWLEDVAELPGDRCYS